MKCQPIAPDGSIISFRLIKKNQNDTRENVGFKVVYNGDTFKFSKLPRKGEILYNNELNQDIYIRGNVEEKEQTQSNN